MCLRRGVEWSEEKESGVSLEWREGGYSQHILPKNSIHIEGIPVASLKFRDTSRPIPIRSCLLWTQIASQMTGLIWISPSHCGWWVTMILGSGASFFLSGYQQLVACHCCQFSSSGYLPVYYYISPCIYLISDITHHLSVKSVDRQSLLLPCKPTLNKVLFYSILFYSMLFYSILSSILNTKDTYY